jgi:hypothetical protein
VQVHVYDVIASSVVVARGWVVLKSHSSTSRRISTSIGDQVIAIGMDNTQCLWIHYNREMSYMTDIDIENFVLRARSLRSTAATALPPQSSLVPQHSGTPGYSRSSYLVLQGLARGNTYPRPSYPPNRGV